MRFLSITLISLAFFSQMEAAFAQKCCCRLRPDVFEFYKNSKARIQLDVPPKITGWNRKELRKYCLDVRNRYSNALLTFNFLTKKIRKSSQSPNSHELGEIRRLAARLESFYLEELNVNNFQAEYQWITEGIKNASILELTFGKTVTKGFEILPFGFSMEVGEDRLKLKKTMSAREMCLDEIEIHIKADVDGVIRRFGADYTSI